MLGVETDFDGSTVGRDFHFSSTPFGGPGLFGGDVLNVNAKAILDLVGYDARPPGLRRHAGQSPDDLRDWRCRLRRRQRALQCVRLHHRRSSFRAARALRGWAGRSAAVLNTRSPTTSRSRANICTPTLGSDHINTVANAAAASEFFRWRVATARFTYNASIFRAGVNYKF